MVTTKNTDEKRKKKKEKHTSLPTKKENRGMIKICLRYL